ncbi:hypothetical protein NC652_027366 [Populus alba x Populus x berolinensis]|nr:hypothetical protein NC652_027366 [Populus alba x Populus x berolinensis]
MIRHLVSPFMSAIALLGIMGVSPPCFGGFRGSTVISPLTQSGRVSKLACKKFHVYCELVTQLARARLAIKLNHGFQSIDMLRNKHRFFVGVAQSIRSYYSMYGHVARLAEEIKKGADTVEGVEIKLWQVPETLPEEVLGKMGAPPKSDVPIIKPNDLTEADGVLFGFPTRFGMMAAQFKAFLDATGGLWGTQQLAGKPAGIFFSTASQGGGQETTALTAITQLVHHGMIFVPIGYTFGAGMFEMEQVKGGSPYGAGTFAGDGTRQPTELELGQAFHQGKYFAGIAKKFKGTA